MLNYQVYKSTRNDRTRGLYYARIVNTEEVNTEALAEIIQDNCSMKKSDVQAVLTELTEVMANQLADGKIVVLNGFGRFKLGIHSTGAESAKDWNQNKNVKSVYCLFAPERKRLSSGKYTQQFLSEVKMKEQSQYTTVTPVAPGV